MNAKNLLNKKFLLFSFVLLIAFYLRYKGINWGLPYVLNMYESDCLSKIFYLSKHFLNPLSVEVPPFYLYLNALILFISNSTFNINNILGALDVNPQALYIPLRFLSMLFGVGAVVVVYFIGKMFSFTCAILTSALLAFSFLPVKFSQVFIPFNAMTFFCMLSLLFVLKSYSKKSSSHLTYAVLFASISTSMHYLGLVSLISILFLVALNKDFSRLKSLLLIYIALFILLNPYIGFYIFSFFIFILKNYIQSFYNNSSSSYLLYLFNFPLEGIGPVAWISAFFIFKYRKLYDLSKLKIIFSVPIFYLSVLGLFHLTSTGYVVLLVPFFCLASALVLNAIYPKREKDFVFIVLILFALWIPLKYSLKYNKITSLSDTRKLATEWVKENTTSDFKLAWDKNSIQLAWHDPYDKSYLKSVVYDPDVLVNKQKFPITSKLLSKKSWLKILKKKVDYVVINDFDYELALRKHKNKFQKKYYKKLLSLKPEITFSPYLKDEEEKKRSSFLLEELYSPVLSLWQRERSGPVIKIFKI